jgi:hypothetical protein
MSNGATNIISLDGYRGPGTYAEALLVQSHQKEAASRLFAGRILALRSCVDAAVKGFGSWGRNRVYRECRSCGRRGHCGACWMSRRLHGRCHECVRSVSRTVIPAMFAAVPIKM